MTKDPAMHSLEIERDALHTACLSYEKQIAGLQKQIEVLKESRVKLQLVEFHAHRALPRFLHIEACHVEPNPKCKCGVRDLAEALLATQREDPATAAVASMLQAAVTSIEAMQKQTAALEQRCAEMQTRIEDALKRAEAAEAEIQEDVGVMNVWRRRTYEAEARVQALLAQIGGIK